MSQKRLLKSVLFILIRVSFFREFGVVKTLEKFENLLKCRKTPARFFNCRKTLVEKPRLDPDSSMLKLFEKKHKTNLKVHKMQEDPCSIFYL